MSITTIYTAKQFRAERPRIDHWTEGMPDDWQGTAADILRLPNMAPWHKLCLVLNNPDDARMINIIDDQVLARIIAAKISESVVRTTIPNPDHRALNAIHVAYLFAAGKCSEEERNTAARDIYKLARDAYDKEPNRWEHDAYWSIIGAIGLADSNSSRKDMPEASHVNATHAAHAHLCANNPDAYEKRKIHKTYMDNPYLRQIQQEYVTITLMVIEGWRPIQFHGWNFKA